MGNAGRVLAIALLEQLDAWSAVCCSMQLLQPVPVRAELHSDHHNGIHQVGRQWSCGSLRGRFVHGSVACIQQTMIQQEVRMMPIGECMEKIEGLYDGSDFTDLHLDPDNRPNDILTPITGPVSFAASTHLLNSASTECVAGSNEDSQVVLQQPIGDLRKIRRLAHSCKR